MIEGDGSPSIVIVPDMQNMTENYPGTLETEMRWIEGTKTVHNIQAVLGVGDLVNSSASVPQWNIAVAAYNILGTNSIRYLPTIGNHDYNTTSTRDTTAYNTYFPEVSISGQSWYGGSYAASLSNSYIKFSTGGVNYLIFSLEMFPRALVCTWASGIIAANPGYTVIVATHGYQKTDGTLVVDADTYGPNAYGLGADYSGQELWDNFLKSEPNLRLVVNGHYIGGGLAHRHAHVSSLGTGGNTVHQLFQNYQEEDLGGAGYLVLIEFIPGNLRVTQVRTSGGVTFSGSWPTYTLPFSPVP